MIKITKQKNDYLCIMLKAYNHFSMKDFYTQPNLEVLELDLGDGMMVPVSGGTGTGSNMLDPDLTQNPFGL